MSPTRRSGASMAAKCPPRPNSDQCTTVCSSSTERRFDTSDGNTATPVGTVERSLAHRGQLQRRPQAVTGSAADAHPLPGGIVEQKHPLQLRLWRAAGKPAKGGRLLIGVELNRHTGHLRRAVSSLDRCCQPSSVESDSMVNVPAVPQSLTTCS